VSRAILAALLGVTAALACGCGSQDSAPSGSKPSSVAESSAAPSTTQARASAAAPKRHAGTRRRPPAPLQPAEGALSVRLPAWAVASVAGAPISRARLEALYARIVHASHQPAPDPPHYKGCEAALAKRLPAHASKPTTAQLERECEQRRQAITAAAMTELLLKAQTTIAPRPGERPRDTERRARATTLCRPGYVTFLCANARSAR
jgi:hypothetical protein